MTGALTSGGADADVIAVVVCLLRHDGVPKTRLEDGARMTFDLVVVVVVDHVIARRHGSGVPCAAARVAVADGEVVEGEVEALAQRQLEEQDARVAGVHRMVHHRTRNVSLRVRNRLDLGRPAQFRYNVDAYKTELIFPIFRFRFFNIKCNRNETTTILKPMHRITSANFYRHTFSRDLFYWSRDELPFYFS